MSLDLDSKVIGFFAYCPPSEVICEGDACIISGGENEMNKYISSIASKDSSKPKIKKTRFGEIIQGMKSGGSYAFDEQSYNRFYPLANKVGYSLKKEDFSDKADTGFHFVIIRP